MTGTDLEGLGARMHHEPVAGHSASGASSNHVEVPEDIAERVRTLCQALPEVTVRVDGSLTRARSTAQSFDIRRRSFCLLVAREGPAGKPVPLLVLQSGPGEREALLHRPPVLRPASRPRPHRGAAHRRHGLGRDP
jgi:hypothetical protein